MRIPSHIGIIPDGNRRWAKAHGLPKHEGYRHGLTPGLTLLAFGLSGRGPGTDVLRVYHRQLRAAPGTGAAFSNACSEAVKTAIR